MEKIYMEENQNNQGRGRINFSVVLSAFVAIIAVVSLIAIGFDQVSYAAETPTGDSAAQSIVLQQGTNPMRIRLESTTGQFDIPVYYRMSNGKRVPVYCVEKHIDAEVGATHTILPIGDLPESLQSTNDQVRYGILKILNESNSAFSGVTNEDVKSAATQAAIWAYLVDVQGANKFHSLETGNEFTSQENRTTIDTFGSITGIGSSNQEVPLSGFTVAAVHNGIQKLITSAKAAGSNERKLQIVADSTSLSKTSDGTYYQSAKLTVKELTNSNTLVSYKVTATGVDGLKVVDKEGTAKSEFAPNDEFYIQVPADKVGEAVQRIKVSVTGTFDGILTGRYYVHSGSQTVVTVETSTTTEDDEITLEVVGSPDTGMNSIQTIYFIGLIVLLCGIGIIYANAKPVEEK